MAEIGHLAGERSTRVSLPPPVAPTVCLCPWRLTPNPPHARFLELQAYSADSVPTAIGPDLVGDFGVGLWSHHTGRGVERLGDADEAQDMPIEEFDHADEVGQRPGQSIDLADDHHVDPAGGDVGKQPLQGSIEPPG